MEKNNINDKELLDMYLNSKKEIFEPDYSEFSLHIENNNIKEINKIINKFPELKIIYKNTINKHKLKNIIFNNSIDSNIKNNSFSSFIILLFTIILFYFYSNIIKENKNNFQIEKFFDSSFQYEDKSFNDYFNEEVNNEEIISNFVSEIDKLNENIYNN
jgi:Fe2+ transport system protein B